MLSLQVRQEVDGALSLGSLRAQCLVLRGRTPVLSSSCSISPTSRTMSRRQNLVWLGSLPRPGLSLPALSRPSPSLRSALGPRLTLQRLDDQSTGSRDDGNGSLTVLDGELASDSETLPVASSFGNVFSDLLGGLNRGLARPNERIEEVDGGKKSESDKARWWNLGDMWIQGLDHSPDPGDRSLVRGRTTHRPLHQSHGGR